MTPEHYVTLSSALRIIDQCASPTGGWVKFPSDASRMLCHACVSSPPPATQAEAVDWPTQDGVWSAECDGVRDYVLAWTPDDASPREVTTWFGDDWLEAHKTRQHREDTIVSSGPPTKFLPCTVSVGEPAQSEAESKWEELRAIMTNRLSMQLPHQYLIATREFLEKMTILDALPIPPVPAPAEPEAERPAMDPEGLLAAQCVNELQEWIESTDDLAEIPHAHLSWTPYTLSVGVGNFILWDDQSREFDLSTENLIAELRSRVATFNLITSHIYDNETRTPSAADDGEGE